MINYFWEVARGYQMLLLRRTLWTQKRVPTPLRRENHGGINRRVRLGCGRRRVPSTQETGFSHGTHLHAWVEQNQEE